MELNQFLKDTIRRLGGGKGSADMPNGDGTLSTVIPRAGTDNVPLATSDLIEIKNLRGARVRWRCGHVFPAMYDLVVYGRTFVMIPEYFADRPFCGECNTSYMRKCSIRCARCGHVIMPGDPSTLHAASADFGANPHWVTMVSGRVICCMRDLCVVSTGFYAGEWTTEGFCLRFEGGRTQNEEVVRTGRPIFLRLPIRSE